MTLLPRLSRWLTSGSASSVRSYWPEDRSYLASPAPLWRRGTAAAIDWTLAGVCYLLVLIPLGIIQTLGLELGGPGGSILVGLAQAAALAVLVAYFTYFLASGHTLGMRALDIHVVAHRTGREPGLPRSFARALVGLGLATGVVNAYAYLAGEPFLGQFSAFERRVGSVATVVALLALAGQLWKLADPFGRTLWDRLTGLVVVEDIVPASMPDRLWSPWGT